LNRPFVDLDKGGKFSFYPVDSDPDGSPHMIKVPEKKLYLGEVEDMNDAILNGKENYISLEESRNHVRTILALYESAKTQRFVRL
jgi:predicted dehydrogenase